MEPVRTCRERWSLPRQPNCERCALALLALQCDFAADELDRLPGGVEAHAVADALGLEASPVKHVEGTCLHLGGHPDAIVGDIDAVAAGFRGNGHRAGWGP